MSKCHYQPCLYLFLVVIDGLCLKIEGFETNASEQTTIVQMAYVTVHTYVYMEADVVKCAYSIFFCFFGLKILVICEFLCMNEYLNSFIIISNKKSRINNPILCNFYGHAIINQSERPCYRRNSHRLAHKQELLLAFFLHIKFHQTWPLQTCIWVSSLINLLESMA